MTKNKGLVTGLVLALAGTLLWAPLSWAQGGRGTGRGPWCPLNQTAQNTWQGQGQGQGNVNCPNYPGFRNRGRGRGMNAQGFRGPRGPQGTGMNAPGGNQNTTQ